MGQKIKVLKKEQKGFTVIEIAAVLAVICVLLALVFTAYSGVRRNERNQERENNIKYLRQKLEAYNVENSKYPSLAEMNDPQWIAKNMKNFNTENLRDPASSSYKLVSKPTKNAYSYDPTSATGGSCDDIKVTCLHYTLTATLEGTTPNTYVKTSLN